MRDYALRPRVYFRPLWKYDEEEGRPIITGPDTRVLFLSKEKDGMLFNDAIELSAEQVEFLNKFFEVNLNE